MKSLSAIGVLQADMLTTGVLLLNMQMTGMLLGGIAWGVLGDKRGRLSVLFGSIIMYSMRESAERVRDDRSAVRRAAAARGYRTGG